MKRPVVRVSPMTHAGERRIRVDFTLYDEENIPLIREVPGRKWYPKLKCWHIPYTREAYAALKKRFEVIEAKAEKKRRENKKAKDARKYKPKKEWGEENGTDSRPARRLRPQIEHVERKTGEVLRYVVGERIIVDKVNRRWLKAFVPARRKAWIHAITQIPNRKWLSDELAWLLPLRRSTAEHLEAWIGAEHVHYNFPQSGKWPEEQFPVKDRDRHSRQTKVSPPSDGPMEGAVVRLKEVLMLEGLSHSTVKSYTHHFRYFLKYYPDLPPDKRNKKHLRGYLLHRIRRDHISESTQNVIINAVKAYWKKVLGRKGEQLEIIRPKRPQKLPQVLSQEEVVRLLEAPRNLKHRLLLTLIYSAGLRLGEAVNLRLQDINLERRSLFIHQAKGKKDRYVTLAESVLPLLEQYRRQYRPSYWLFEGQYGGQYSKRSVQSVFRRAVEHSGVNPYATVHTLRHSYATHCLENGFSLKLIQESLGHHSLKTTERYLHVTSKALKQLRSPFDLIQGEGLPRGKEEEE